MLAVEKWAQEKNPFIALIAVHLVLLSRELAESFAAPDLRVSFHQEEVPPLATWLSLYRSHRSYSGTFLEWISIGSQYGKEVLPLVAGFYELSRRKYNLSSYQITVDQFMDARSNLLNLQQLTYAYIRDEINNTALQPDVEMRLFQFFTAHKTELFFVLCVALPCWFFYQTTPVRLYRKAMKGDFHALKKILCLDPFTLHDPVIGRRIQEFRLKGKAGAYQQLLEATTKPIKAKLTKKSIKASAAALLSTLAKALKQPLTEPEIRQLYDAVAKDIEKSLIDTTLPKSPEANTKAIQRNRPDWEKIIFRTDKSEGVSG